MNSAEANYQLPLPPVSANGAATVNVIDTAGYDYLELILLLGVGAGSAAMTTCKVQESDVKASGTSLTSGADVPGLIAGTSLTVAGPSGVFPQTPTYPATTLPASNNTIVLFKIDLKTRKRYLLPVDVTGGATVLAIVARLSRAEVAPHLPAQEVPANGQVLSNPAPAYTAGGL
jgi:hypothetical protein